MLLDKSPLRADIIRGARFCVYPELTGGMYFGKSMKVTMRGLGYHFIHAVR